MTSSGRGLVLGLAVAMGVLATARAQGGRGAEGEVLELAREAEAGKDVTKRAAALSKRFRDVHAAMRVYNPRSAGGLGLGPRGEGIERRLVDLGEGTLSADALKKESGELVQVAHLTFILAEVTRGHAPAKPFLGRGKKEWERDLEGVKAGSQALLQAVKAGEPRAVRTAAARINQACNNCHDGVP